MAYENQPQLLDYCREPDLPPTLLLQAKQKITGSVSTGTARLTDELGWTPRSIPTSRA